MPFKISVENSFKDDLKDLKHLAKVKEEFAQVLEILRETPVKIGKHLKGNLIGMYNLEIAGKKYRVIYRVYQCCAKSPCIYEDETSDDSTQKDGCSGVVQLLFFKTREACNNLYAHRKKYFNCSLLDLNIWE